MDDKLKNIVDSLRTKQDIDRSDLKYLLTCDGEDNIEYLYENAREVSDSVFHKDVASHFYAVLMPQQYLPVAVPKYFPVPIDTTQQTQKA